MASSPLDFDFQFGRAAPGQPRDEEAPFRILVIGEFSGSHGEARATPLAARRARRVDIDRFDRAFAECAPAIRVTAAGQPVGVQFDSLDAFHPDSLYARLPLFAALRNLRAELQDPALYRRAAAALGVASASAASTAAAPDTTSAADDIQRLLGRPPQASAPVSSAAAARPALDPAAALIRSVVDKHSVPDTLREQQDLTAAADRAIAGEMRSVLHDPAFQSLEARWRALWRLVGTVEDAERVHVHLLDANLAELAADIAGGGGDLSRTALASLLCGPATQSVDGEPWSMIVVDHCFAPTDAEVVLLAALANLACAAGAPLLAGADPRLAGAADAAALADPARWQPPTGAAAALWQQLRASRLAPWIGLALPRVLERLPYGAKTDPVDAFDLDEMGGAPDGGRDHRAYLWSNPALSLACLAVRAFEEDGWSLDLDSFRDLDDLPSHHYREDGESKQQACAEAYFSELAADALLARGLMPLMSYRNRNACKLLRWQSIASPGAALAGFS